MKTRGSSKKAKMVMLVSIGGVLLLVLIIAIGIVSNSITSTHAASASSRSTHDRRDVLPPIPAALKVPQGNVFLFRLFGSGVQIYTCPVTPASDPAPITVLRTTVFLTSTVVGSHFLNNAGGLAWQSLNGSTVVAAPLVKIPAPNPNRDIPWVLLQAQTNTGGAPFGNVTFLQRVFTTGGVPRTPCGPNQLQIEVPFSTQYWFYGPSWATYHFS